MEKLTERCENTINYEAEIKDLCDKYREELRCWQKQIDELRKENEILKLKRREACQLGYNQGANDMENEKQIIIDGLFEQIKVLEKKMINRPIELYAVEDCIRGNIIFNARGGCYRNVADANDKISRLLKEHNDKSYRIVTYRLQ